MGLFFLNMCTITLPLLVAQLPPSVGYLTEMRKCANAARVHMKREKRDSSICAENKEVREENDIGGLPNI